MELEAAVQKYLEAVKEFGRPMPLSQFGIPRSELEAALSIWEEDYALHRHFELIPAPASPSARDSAASLDMYVVQGFPCSAIVFKETVRHVLG